MPGDFDNDGKVTLDDYAIFAACLSGPDSTTPPPGCPGADFADTDLDFDADVDMDDYSAWIQLFSG